MNGRKIPDTSDSESEDTRDRAMHELTSLQRDLLYVIAGKEEPHGQAIGRELEGDYETLIDRGHLYPNLNALVNNGLVEKRQRDPRTNSYTLTERGRQAIQARREWEDRYLKSKLSV